jgi:hypothetical protein
MPCSGNVCNLGLKCTNLQTDLLVWLATLCILWLAYCYRGPPAYPESAAATPEFFQSTKFFAGDFCRQTLKLLRVPTPELRIPWAMDRATQRESRTMSACP